ncbi:MAG: TIGR04076 family protein [Firmicutes bacterium]|nr:TIGR04076 family protein [Bacillota bacterium]
MHKVRITVLKKEFYPDLAQEYGAETMKPCPFFETGQVFISRENNSPSGFPCEDAWACLSRNVYTLSAGGIDFYDGRWLKKGSHICVNCCNDGMRPVVFKLEAIE